MHTLPLLLLKLGVLLLTAPFLACAADFTITDDDGLTAWVRTPVEKPKPGKTYRLVVSVHGVGASGKHGLAFLADWPALDDVIVLAPTFAPPKEKGREGYATSYQMSGPAHVAKLEALITELDGTWKLHPKIILNGFSAGAQFAHRYAMLHPERVAAVAAHSGGSWAKTEGDDRINPAAKSIPFAISCGELDTKRLVAARTFSDSLKALDFAVDFHSWPEVAHTFSPGASAQTLTLVQRLRAGDFP